MCMLFVKPKGFTLPDNHFKSLQRKNADGVAIYNALTGELFKSLDYVAVKEYMADNHETELVVHFRYGTSGKNSLDQLHGFEVCNNEYYLFHNGVLWSYLGDAFLGLSDTQQLVQDFKDSTVEELIDFLEKNERTSRFLIVRKSDGEYLIPKCAKWDGDATFDHVKINYSNSYAIDYNLLDSQPLRWKNYSTTRFDSSMYDHLYEDEDDGSRLDVDDFMNYEPSEEEINLIKIDILDKMWRDSPDLEGFMIKNIRSVRGLIEDLLIKEKIVC